MLSHRKTASSSAVWRSATTPWPNISWKGNDLEKAPDYSIKAGDLAHAQSTFPRAQTHYQVAAELLEDRGAEGAI